MGDFEGKIIADAASNHIGGSKGRPIVMCFCWAHALRKFRDLEDELSIVSIPLAFIRQFYEIDKSADGDEGVYNFVYGRYCWGISEPPPTAPLIGCAGASGAIGGNPKMQG